MNLNLTIEVTDEASALACVNWIEQSAQVYDWSILTDTSKMYEQSEAYRKICSAYKKAKRERDVFINNNNSKFN